MLNTSIEIFILIIVFSAQKFMFGYFYNFYLFVDIFISFEYQFYDLIFLFPYPSGSLNIFKTIKVFFFKYV